MPLLDRTGLIADPFTGPTAEGDWPTGPVLVDWADIADALGRRDDAQAIGVHVPNTLKAVELAFLLPRLALVSIAFPAFNDGRGFSIAHQLRRKGYRGRLRATGPLIADQFAFALQCGFDEVAIPDALLARQSVDQWLAALGAITLPYQSSHTGAAGTSVLERRRAARLAEAGHVG